MANDDQRNQTEHFKFTFGLIVHPGHNGWPKHGAFLIENGKGGSTTTYDVFSVQACRDLLAAAVEDKALSSDEAAIVERQAAETGLPHELTRFDRICRVYGDTSQYTRLVGQFCGAQPPEEGSGPVRLQRCTEGRHCRSESCERLPAHFVLFPAGIRVPFANIFFSQKGAEEILTRTIEIGLITQDEKDQVLAPQLVALSQSPEAEQADRFMRRVLPSGWERHLDVVFGLAKPEKPARFEFCPNGEPRHFHFHVYNDQEVGIGVWSEFDAQRMLDVSFKSGLIDQTSHERLTAQVLNLKLPKGSAEESRYGRQRRVVQMEIHFDLDGSLYSSDDDDGE